MLKRGLNLALGLAAGIAGLAATHGTAHATDGGTSLYLLGSGGPGTAIMPPLEGVYFDKIIYVYDASAEATLDFPLNGNIVAGLDATVIADFTTLLFVPSTDVLGGTLALGVTMPLGAPIIDAEALLTAPGGESFARSVHDSTLAPGDPVAIAQLGWQTGTLHVQVATMVNVPVGHYRQGGLANIALHRWAVDGSLALSWHDPETGWDITAKGGYTWNGHNRDTGYDSGDEIHLEASVEKALSPKFSLGAQTYYNRQISDDDGAVGPFRGEAFAVGLTASTNVVMGGSPATFKFRVMDELETKNRLEGTSFWVDFSIPLSMKMPTQ